MARHILLDKIDKGGIGKLKRVLSVVEATEDNQKVFTIPKENFDRDLHLFEIRIGSTWFSDERYDIVDNTIVLKESEEGIEKGRRVSFLFFYIVNTL